MKTILGLGLLVTIAISIALSNVNTPSTYSNSPKSNALEKKPKDKILQCPTIEAFLSKWEKLSDSLENKNDSDAAAISLANELGLKEIENKALENSDCGALATSTLLNVYKTLKQPEKWTAAHTRLLKLAESKNLVATRALCLGHNEYPLPNFQEKSVYCMALLKVEDNFLAELELYNAFAITDQYENFANYCQSEPKTESKNRCYRELSLWGDRLYYLQNSNNSEASYSKALKIYERVARDYGNHEAFIVGYMYQNGEGTKKNNIKAIFWYGKYLEKESDITMRHIALNDMGVAYYDLADYVSAFQSYKSAAELGVSSISQLNVARMYAFGEGVLTDYKEAYAWVSIAIAKGLRTNNLQVDANKLKDWVTKKLNDDKSSHALKEAEDLAKEYYKKYVLHEKKIKEKRTFSNIFGDQ